MRYAQLRAFHHVALSGGFSAAAERLNQTQPSISDQVKKLERAHDVLLFRREARKVTLTDEGRALFRLTRTFFDDEEAIAAYLSGARARMSGRLRIVADAAAHVTALVGRFRVAHPDVIVSLGAGNTEEVLTRLRDYEAEVGVVGNLGSAPDLHRVELGRSAIVGIAAHGLVPPSTTRLDWCALTRLPLVFREPGSRTRAVLEEAIRLTGVDLRPSIEVEGREAMREIVAAGAGLGFVSEAEFGHDTRLRKIALGGIDLSMSETLVTLKQRQDVPIIRAFIAGIDRGMRHETPSAGEGGGHA